VEDTDATRVELIDQRLHNALTASPRNMLENDM
jgi:hypothetical protein